ncbi:MAG: hypothetical protein KDB03_26895, partial [Planctomycetales bacterium]|nr:hypothetical protein [Planctomycetales bacterium]
MPKTEIQCCPNNRFALTAYHHGIVSDVAFRAAVAAYVMGTAETVTASLVANGAIDRTQYKQIQRLLELADADDLPLVADETLVSHSLDGENPDGENLDGENLDGENLDGENLDGENLDGENL